MLGNFDGELPVEILLISGAAARTSRPNLFDN
jgi:hypothetical protein